MNVYNFDYLWKRGLKYNTKQMDVNASPKKNEPQLVNKSLIVLLPLELKHYIIDYLRIDDIYCLGMIDKYFNLLVKDKIECLTRMKMINNFFGTREWKDIMKVKMSKDAPVVPKRYIKDLEEKCPFEKDKKVKDTHFLFLLPKTIEDENVSINNLGKLLNKKKSEGVVKKGWFVRSMNGAK